MRPLIYITVAMLLALLGIVGVREAAGYRRASAEREVRVSRERLATYVDQWEEGIAYASQLWLTELASVDSIREREQYLRDKFPWFDAFYLWEEGDVLYPPTRADEDLATLRADPCLSEAARRAGMLDNTAAAAAYASCIGRTTPVSLLAASEAAELLLNAEQPAIADNVVRSVGSIAKIPLQDASGYGISPRRLVFLRLQHARALDMLGRGDIAERWVRGLASEIASLDGEALEGLIELYEYPVGHDLREYGGPRIGGEDDEALARALRRLALYQEIRDHTWIARDAPSMSHGPRLLVDQYGDPPYLLSYARLETGIVSGVQIDQPELLQSFLDRAPPSLRRDLTIRDPAGRVLRGAQGDLLVEIAFTRVLPHLRVGVVDAPGRSIVGIRTLVAQLIPIILGICVGVFALLSLIHTDRQQARLLLRQREFMTRVTHELKTPLAGIRLMAENLEMGSFRDVAQREKFARQIVKEAERLGMRLDEVIHAASNPPEERALVLDAAAMVAELAERWRPLFEQQGVTLVAEAPPGAVKIVARSGQLRDAITNLLDNSLKYRNPERPGRCWLRLRVERRWVQFEVEDDGIGVPAGMRKVIFDRFRRVEGPGRGRAGGHGLGLAFVAEAARMHGGKVECREGTDGGSRFILRIRRRS